MKPNRSVISQSKTSSQCRRPSQSSIASSKFESKKSVASLAGIKPDDINKAIETSIKLSEEGRRRIASLSRADRRPAPHSLHTEPSSGLFMNERKAEDNALVHKISMLHDQFTRMYKSINQTAQMTAAQASQNSLLQNQLEATLLENEAYEKQIQTARETTTKYEAQYQKIVKDGASRVLLQVKLRELDQMARDIKNKIEATGYEVEDLSTRNDEMELALLMKEKDVLTQKDITISKKEDNIRRDTRNLEFGEGVKENKEKANEIRANTGIFEEKLSILRNYIEERRSEVKMLNSQVSEAIALTRNFADRSNDLEKRLTIIRDENITKGNRLTILVKKERDNLLRCEKLQGQMYELLSWQRLLMWLQESNKSIRSHMTLIASRLECQEASIFSGKNGSAILIENRSLNNSYSKGRLSAAREENHVKRPSEIDSLLLDEEHPENKENIPVMVKVVEAPRIALKEKSVVAILEVVESEIEKESSLSVAPEEMPNSTQRPGSYSRHRLKSLSEFDI